MQTASIRAALDDFEWVFVQGTVRHTEGKKHERTPTERKRLTPSMNVTGNWSLHTSEFSKLPLYTYYNPFDPQSILQTHEELLHIIKTNGPFDGVCAYSGGAALAAELMIEAARSESAIEPLFRFAVFVNGATPLRVFPVDNVDTLTDHVNMSGTFQEAQEMFLRPSALRHKAGVSEEDQVDHERLLGLLSRLEGRMMVDGTPFLTDGTNGLCRWERKESQPALIEIPTLHVRSTAEDDMDPHHGKRLVELCEEYQAEEIHHEFGHDFPRGRQLMKQIADAIRELAELS